MTSRGFRDRLQRRLSQAGIPALPADAADRIETYVQLLARWNRKINLTALPLDPPTDEALDRLLVEPIAAVRHLVPIDGDWLDIGSGGGSPAVPLKLAGVQPSLTMVESRTRKAAFLREVVRVLNLADTSIANERFEDLVLRQPETAQLVTVRAVRTDVSFAELAHRALGPDGRLAIFCPAPLRSDLPGLNHIHNVQLIDGKASYLGLYERVFHVEQTR